MVEASRVLKIVFGKAVSYCHLSRECTLDVGIDNVDLFKVKVRSTLDIVMIYRPMSSHLSSMFLYPQYLDTCCCQTI